MSAAPSRAASPSREDQSMLLAAIAACRIARAASRALDGEIALATFPSLNDLVRIDAGVWRQRDGSRVRALRYSELRQAAATLVPAGCWVEDRQHGIVVSGALGDWFGEHPLEPVALCIAALEARAAKAGHVD